MKKIFKLCFIATILLYIIQNDLIEYALYLTGFIISAYIMLMSVLFSYYLFLTEKAE